MPRGKEPWGTRYIGKPAVREGLATRLEGIPDIHYGEDRHRLAGNPGVSTLLLTGATKAGEQNADLRAARASLPVNANVGLTEG